MRKQTTIVVIGTLRVNAVLLHHAFADIHNLSQCAISNEKILKFY